MLFERKMATLAGLGRSDSVLDKVIACITANVGPLAYCRQSLPKSVTSELLVIQGQFGRRPLLRHCHRSASDRIGALPRGNVAAKRSRLLGRA